MKDFYKTVLKTLVLIAVVAGIFGCSAWYSVFGMNQDEAKKVYQTVTAAWDELMAVTTTPPPVVNADGSETQSISTAGGTLVEEIYFPTGSSGAPPTVGTITFAGYTPAGGDYTLDGSSDLTISQESVTVPTYKVVSLAHGMKCSGGPISTLDFALKATMTSSTSGPGTMSAFSGTITVNNDTFDVADLQ